MIKYLFRLRRLGMSLCYWIITIKILNTLDTGNPFSTNKYPQFNCTCYSTMMTEGNILDSIRSCVPVLNEKLYKGNCGRLGVIGGCKEYTGAPYFAAITILKMVNFIYLLNYNLF